MHTIATIKSICIFRIFTISLNRLGSIKMIRILILSNAPYPRKFFLRW